ncbi:DUF6531 domain-containing protein [Streptomyces sp. NPDC048257]|uniref:DUF6531 domain-containing protein n=1 Tax=Streptomyces sp. NPDC048257 TaxID=3365526 RepID=UPI00371FA693
MHPLRAVVPSGPGQHRDRHVLRPDTDAALPGVGTPFSLDRTYRSDSTTVGLLGRGWSTPFVSKLTIAAGTSATLLTADGAQAVFKEQAGGTYTTPAGSTLKLAKTGTTYAVTTADHTRHMCSASGQLASLTDRGGQGLTLTYSSGRLASVKDAAGRSISFTLDSLASRPGSRGRSRSDTTSGTP